MGGGSYSISSSISRGLGYQSRGIEDLFSSRTLDSRLDPKGVELRECCDSEEHPNSLPIIIALDETGSMGTIPDFLVRKGLVSFMEKILTKGVKDPQVMFMGVGDHKSDNAPLQISQFESSDELLDEWLKSIYLEGRGGGNNGESYMLPWYFAAKKTSIDCFNKRGQKGILVTIGDEPVHSYLSSSDIKTIFGDEGRGYSTVELLEMAQEKYDVYHIHLKHGYQDDGEVANGWKELLHDNLIVIDDKNQTADGLAEILLKDRIKTSYNSTEKPSVLNEVPDAFKIDMM